MVIYHGQEIRKNHLKNKTNKSSQFASHAQSRAWTHAACFLKTEVM